MKPSFILAVVACALCGSVVAHADAWEFFHAETVTKLSCSVVMVESSSHESGTSVSFWEALARAERNDRSLGTWSMTIAEYPQTLKGRHLAERACSRWMDDASKRVKAAQR